MEKKDLKKGQLVTYTPRNCTDISKRELGKITSWNDHFVFVDYHNTGRGQATEIDLLMKGDHTIYHEKK